MEPAIGVAIGALIVSCFSLIATLISSVYTAKTYKKNRRLEFLQKERPPIPADFGLERQKYRIPADFSQVWACCGQERWAPTARGTSRTKHGPDCFL